MSEVTLKELRITHTFDSIVRLTPEGATELLNHCAAARNILSLDPDAGGIPPGMRVAAGLITDDHMLDDSKLAIILGETISHILKTAFASYAYPQDLGILCHIPRAAYQETPEKLPPPADVKPVIVQIGDRAKP